MKPVKDLIAFLVIEVFGIVWAAVCFKLIPSTLIAGGLAGGFFLLSGIYMLLKILRWPRWWEAWVLYPMLVYLFGCTIPMLWERFTHMNLAFSEVKVWGIPGPEFHHISSSTLGLLILVTLVETGAAIFKRRPRANA